MGTGTIYLDPVGAVIADKAEGLPPFRVQILEDGVGPFPKFPDLDSDVRITRSTLVLARQTLCFHHLR